MWEAISFTSTPFSFRTVLLFRSDRSSAANPLETAFSCSASAAERAANASSNEPCCQQRLGLLQRPLHLGQVDGHLDVVLGDVHHAVSPVLELLPER